MEVPIGGQELTVVHAVAFVWQNAALPIVIYISRIVETFFPWPIVALFLIIAVIFRPERFSAFLSLIGEFEGFGVKFKGKASSAPTKALRKELGDAERVVERANSEIGEAYVAANAFASQLREKYEISKYVSRFSNQVAGIVGSNCPDDFRLTIYIPDLIFDDRLYQFTEYYDKNGGRSTEGKAGRTLSIRYGIVGRVWRSSVSEIEGDLLSPEDREQMTREGLTRKNPEHLAKFIARRWGLTIEEVSHIVQYNSYGAVLLGDSSQAFGLVYFDSRRLKAFGDRAEEESVREKVQQLARDSVLLKQLKEIDRELGPWAGSIKIFRAPR